MNVQPDLAVHIASAHGQQLRVTAARQHAGRLARGDRRRGVKVNRHRYRPGHSGFEPARPTVAPAR